MKAFLDAAVSGIASGRQVLLPYEQTDFVVGESQNFSGGTDSDNRINRDGRNDPNQVPGVVAFRMKNHPFSCNHERMSTNELCALASRPPKPSGIPLDLVEELGILTQSKDVRTVVASSAIGQGAFLCRRALLE